MAAHDRLKAPFFARTDVVQISRDLLGKVLCTRIDGVLTSGIIVETEAYHGPEDKASHAYGMRRTARTEPMFGRPGVSYVYLCYGIHHLFNIVTAPAGTPHAVLIRAIEPVDGQDTMQIRRGMDNSLPRLTAGPGSLSTALGIRTQHTGVNMLSGDALIWVEDRGLRVTSRQIIASPRVGVSYAQEWAERPWRFRIKENRWTSPAR